MAIIREVTDHFVFICILFYLNGIRKQWLNTIKLKAIQCFKIFKSKLRLIIWFNSDHFVVAIEVKILKNVLAILAGE